MDKGQPIMAWAGFFRNVYDIGPCYAGMTMEANASIPFTNGRMPVPLQPEAIDTWLRLDLSERHPVPISRRSPPTAWT